VVLVTSHAERVQWLIVMLTCGILLLVIGIVSLLLGGRAYDRSPDGAAWHGRYGRFAVGFGVVIVLVGVASLRWGL
jgi:hypothetical protein